MKWIKIGISGPHGTGKTTFANLLRDQFTDNSINCKVISGLAKKNPLPILRKQTLESTLWMASEAIAQELETEDTANIILADRPIIDYWAYMKASAAYVHNEDSLVYLTLKNLIQNWVATYDIIYQTVIDDTIKIEDNMSRDLDPVFRKKIEEEMRATTKLFKLLPRELTSTNVNEEIEFVRDYISKNNPSTLV